MMEDGRMLFVCCPKCATCQKVRKRPDGHGAAYDFRDVKENNPAEEELRAWRARSGLPLKRFFNIGGLRYKAQNLKNRLPEMRGNGRFALPVTEGMLVRRPRLISDKHVPAGRREAEQQSLIP